MANLPAEELVAPHLVAALQLVAPLHLVEARHVAAADAVHGEDLDAHGAVARVRERGDHRFPWARTSARACLHLLAVQYSPRNCSCGVSHARLAQRFFVMTTEPAGSAVTRPSGPPRYLDISRTDRQAWAVS